jgi:nucleoside-diphosphate-sugar epimerase
MTLVKKSGCPNNNLLKEDLDHVLAHTEVLWEELRGKKVFITGGTGFCGCWLLESFAWANEKMGLNASMLVLTRNLETFQKKAPHLTNQPAIAFHVGDVCSFDFPRGEFQYIIHAAASLDSDLHGEKSLQIFETIIDGTRHTLEFARQCGVKKILLTSSGAIYGKQPAEITHITEDYHGAPDSTDWHSAYGEGKRAAEHLCILNARKYGFEAKIARCFAFVGPYQPLDGQWAIGNFIRDGINGKQIVVNGDGTPIRSYLYAADLMIFLWTILLKGESCLPYNVGSDQEIDIRSLAELVSSVLEKKKEVIILKKSDLLACFDRYVPSVRRARDQLAVKQEIDLRDGIKRTIKYIKSREGKR